VASLEDRLAQTLRTEGQARAVKPAPPPEKRGVAPRPPRKAEASKPRIYRETEGGVLLSLSEADDGEGDILDLGLVLHRHTLQVNPEGDVSGGRVALQGSLDAERWFTLAGINLEAGHNVFFAGSAPASAGHEPIAFRYLRAVIVKAVMGGTIDAYVGA
jgi:hypothetical protein